MPPRWNRSTSTIKHSFLRSLNGNTLAFNRQQDQFVWSENSQYALRPYMPAFAMGNLENFLFLESAESRHNGMLLVPFQEVNNLQENKNTNTLLLKINNAVPLMTPPQRVERQGVLQYFNYLVVNGKIQSYSLEGKLFLAYLYFAQKRYQEAVAIFKEIKPLDSFSPISLKILEMIQVLPIIEDHPDAKMVALHATALVLLEKERKSTHLISQHFSTKIEIAALKKWIEYLYHLLNSSNNISVGCCMDLELETFLLSRILSEAQKNAMELNEKQDKQKVPIDLYIHFIKNRLDILRQKSQAPPPHILGTGIRKQKELATINREKLSLVSYQSKPLPPNKSNYIYATREEAKKAKAYYKTSYEEALSTYNKDLQNYQRGVTNAVAWLNSGEISYRSLAPNSTCSIQKNGKLLLEVLRIAHRCTKSEQREMLYRLHLWNILKKSPFIDLLIKIIYDPKQFPESEKLLIPQADEDKYHLLIKLTKNYTNYNKEISTAVLTQKITDSPNLIPLSPRFKEGHFPIAAPNFFAMAHAKNTTNPVQIVDVKIPLNTTRWEQLEEWKKHFMIEVKPNQLPYKDFSYSFDDKFLDKKEESYRESVKRDFQLSKQDYEEGKKQNEAQIKFTISQNEGNTLKEYIEKALDEVQKNKEEKKTLLIKKINLSNAVDLALMAGQVITPLTWDDCTDCLLALNTDAYQKKNPNLTHSQKIKEIADLTLEVEDLKSYETQLQRLSSLVDEILLFDDPANPNRSYLCQKLAHELDARYHFEDFNIEQEVVLRVFAGETGILLFKKQADLIKKMLRMQDEDPTQYRDIVIQLIMGGGKTSVIATLLLYFATRRKGRLPLFIVPPSLFETVKANFSDAIYQAFHKQTFALNLNREDLTIYKLEQTYNDLQLAADRGIPIVVNATTLQCLELELLSQARKVKDIIKEKAAISEKISKLDIQLKSNKKQDVEKARIGKERLTEALKSTNLISAEEKLKALSKVVELFPEKGDALLDEIDLILDYTHEVNFPDGEEIRIHPVRHQLLHCIYKALTEQELKIPTLPGEPSMVDIVRLHANDQTLMSQETYLHHVVPVAAAYVAKHFKPIANQLGSYTSSFIRYVSGEIPTVLQTFVDEHRSLSSSDIEKDPHLSKLSFTDIQNDLAFLKHLHRLYFEGDEKQKDTANLIAVAKHFFQDLTPSTLNRTGRRNYGLSPNPKTPGKMIPYMGINTPNTTEFGYHWEAAAYYYQWVASFVPDREQILEIAKSANAAARYYMQKNTEKFEETAEYEEFFELFGVKLDEIEIPGNIEKAIAYITPDIKKRLDLQYETVSRYVTFRKERLSSCGMNLMDQLSSRRTMSGTPWNYEGFHPIPLAKSFEPDLGTEGKIFHTLAMRAAEKKIIEVAFTTMEEYLDQVFLKHPNPKRIRGIIELGGLFKGLGTNDEVAKSIMHYVERKQEQKDPKVDPEIEGVLFFHKDPGHIQPNTAYVYKKGAHFPERIGGTSIEALKAKGLNPKKYFVYYDEKHTTGIDILQIPDSINLVTFDVKVTRRTLSQGEMRLRQYLFEQDTDFVVVGEGRQSLLNKAREVEDLVLHSEKTQSVRKTQAMERYFIQHIHRLSRHKAVQKIREAVVRNVKNANFAHLVEQYEPHFVDTMKEEPYLQHGRLTQYVDTKVGLKNYLDKKIENFKLQIQDPLVVAKIEQEKNELKSWIDESKSLPAQWKDRNSPLGIEQEVAVQQEIQKQIEQEIEKEIELELCHYEKEPGDNFLVEKPLSLEEFLALIENTKKFYMLSLQKQLSKYPYGLAEKIHYEKAFSQPIYGTDAYFNTCTNRTLPFFHPLQRPPKQILVVHHGDKILWLLLSEFEADSARKHLTKLYEQEVKEVQGVWLIQPNGSFLAKGTITEELPEEQAFYEGLLEINALAGNADYLDRYPEDTENWLSENREIKIRFLKLKALRNLAQRQILLQSPTIRAFDQDENSIQTMFTFRKRVEKESTRQGRFIPESPCAAKLLNPRKINDLNIRYVPYLGIRWKRRKSDPLIKQALEQLNNPPKNNKELKKAAESLTTSQFSRLQPYQCPYLTCEQIRWLPVEKVQYLEKPEQIFTKEEKKNKAGKNIATTKYLLSREQARGLKEHQKNFIPYIKNAYYWDFDEAWQIASVPCEHVNKINPKYLYLLAKEQVKGIPFQYKEYIGSLHPQMMGWVQGNLIDAIDPSHFEYICAEQIAEINEPLKIESLEQLAEKNEKIKPGLWTSWIHPKMVRHINPETQLHYLKSTDQIKEIPNAWIPKLAVYQVNLICSHQVPFLEGKAQIQACPNDSICYLGEKQLEYLHPEQIPHLRDQQIRLIKTPELFAYLKAENTAEGHLNQMIWIAKEQIGWVTKEQVKGLSTEQLLLLSTRPDFNELQPFMTKAQIQNFDTPELIHLLTKKQIREHLQQFQVKFLIEAWQIQACPLTLVQHLDPQNQVVHIDIEQVPYLKGANQVQVLNREELFIALTAEDNNDTKSVNQLVWISDQQLKWIAKHQVKGLSKEQILKVSKLGNWNELQPEITAAQISTFDSKVLIDLLSIEQLKKHLTQQQVKFLSQAWQIQACDKKLFLYMDKDAQIPHLSEIQIAQINKAEELVLLQPEQWQHLSAVGIKRLSDKMVSKFQLDSNNYPKIKFINANQIHLITDEGAFEHVVPEQLQALNENQVNSFDNKHAFWKRIPSNLVSKVALKHLKALSTEKLKYIKDKKVIQGIPFAHVQYLTREQLRQRSWRQFAVYLVGVIALGVALSVVALIAYLSLIPFIVYAMSKYKGKRMMRQLNENPLRLYRFVNTYCGCGFQ